jgi:SM-20-related protein
MTAISIDYGTVQVFDDAVPADLYGGLLETIPNLGWQFGWRSRLALARYWHHELSGGQKDNIVDVSDVVRTHPSPLFARYVDWLRSEVVPAETRLLRLYLNAHTFGTDGSVHTDTERKDELTTVLFLNRNWKADFGGETVVFDERGEIDTAVLPKENRLLTFPSDREHGPRPLSKMFLGLRVVLVAKLGAADGSNTGWIRRD